MIAIKGIVDSLYGFCKEKNVKSYFVGGFVRDLLLNRITKDLDVVISTSYPINKIVKEFASKIGGSFVCLDETHNIYRIVYKKILIDFSKMRGRNIEKDLSLRDFTINSMAIPVVDSFKLFSTDKELVIDPFDGVSDLKNKLIRMVTEKIFDDDPLRLLRAYRLSASLEFNIDNTTKELIMAKNYLIKKVAQERIRDEFLRILSVKNSYKYINALDEIGILNQILPEINIMKNAVECYYHKQGLWEHSIETLNSLEEIFFKLPFLFPKNYNNLIEHLEEEVLGSYKKEVILKLAALFHDLGKPSKLKIIKGKVRFLGHEAEGAKLTKKIFTRLKLSNKVINSVEKIILNHMRPGNLSSAHQLTDRAIWRFFCDLNTEGVDTLLVSLSDRYSYRKVQTKEKEMKKQQLITEQMFEKYYGKRNQILPKPLLNGNDLISKFGIYEGPEIGKLLEILVEAQVVRKIETKKEAMEFMKKTLEKKT